MLVIHHYRHGKPARECTVCSPGGKSTRTVGPGCTTETDAPCPITTAVCRRRWNLRSSSTGACTQLISGRGGYAVVGSVVLRAEDCSQSFYGFELSGFDSDADCVTETLSRAECSGETTSASGLSCVRRPTTRLSAEIWARYCSAAFDRSTVICDGSGSIEYSNR